MDKKGKNRHEIVPGVSSFRRRQTGQRTERGRILRPIQETAQNQQENQQENNVQRPVQETHPPQANGAAPRRSGLRVHAQETGPPPDRPPDVHRYDRTMVNRLSDALWNSSSEVKQLKAKEMELEKEKKKVEEDKQRLERENEALRSQVARNQRELQDKQNEIDELTKARDAKLESLNRKIDDLKKHTSNAEKDRQAKIAECERKLAKVCQEYEEKLNQCREEKKDIKTRLNECKSELREKERNILKLEGKIELLSEQRDKSKQDFVCAKRRAICHHWVGAFITLIVLLGLVVVLYVFMLYWKWSFEIGNFRCSFIGD